MKSQIKINRSQNSLLKKCRSKDEFDRELRVYQLQLDFLPNLISIKDNDTLELEFIAGETLSENQNLDFALFALMFAKLHQQTIIKVNPSIFKSRKKADLRVICHIDTNPKNYLIRNTDEKYFMVDFSGSRYSFPEHDLFNFMLFWAACYSPVRFQKALLSFLTSYSAKLLVSSVNEPLLRFWADVFDCRRILYRKKPQIAEEWQYQNRKLLFAGFYEILL